jgi:hypothetical protein
MAADRRSDDGRDETKTNEPKKTTPQNGRPW